MFLFAIVVVEDANKAHPGFLSQLRRFLSRPLHEKSRSLYARWREHFPSIPFPVRLSFGAWFIARNDYVGSTLTSDAFECAERAFVERYLRPGMIVLDIGAHHGLYTLLAARQVGGPGHVYSFEPSPREQKALRLNLRLNRFSNVRVEPFALGSRETTSDLYVVDAFNTGCNSLRPPQVTEQISSTRVRITTLDNWLAEAKLDHVDFIKLDVEGGERDALTGAQVALRREPRPVIMCEMEGVRTAPWGYKPEEIASHLRNLGFQWFQPTVEGNLLPLSLGVDKFEGNYVAVPEERMAQIATFRT